MKMQRPLTCAVSAVLFSLLLPTGAAPSRSGPPAPPDESISGVYVWVKDSGGGAPKPKAVVALDFAAAGQVTAIASQPDERWTSEGTYALKNGRLDLDLPELGWKAQAAPFKLDKAGLTLPFQVLTDKAGTSSWRQARPSRLPGLRALAAFDEAIGEGLRGEAARDRVMDILRREYGAPTAGDPAAEPPGPGPRAARSTDGPIIKVDKDYRNLFLSYDDGGPHETIMLQSFLRDEPERKPIPLKIHPIGADPRTQRRDKPVNSEDNPKKLVAWLLNPNWTSSFYSYNGPVFDAGGAERTIKVKGRTDSSKNYGIDPISHQKVLEWAGYMVKTARDGDVTLKRIVEALRDEPGALILSGHGTLSDRGLRKSLAVPRDIPVFMTGVILYDYWESFDKEREKEIPVFRDEMRRRMDEQVEAVKEYFPDLPEPGNERRYEILDHYFRNLWMPLSKSTGQVWLGFTSDFLALVRAHDGLDFSRSLVFLSSCDSATNAEGAMALRPKVYFGYSGTEYIRGATRIEKYLVAALARPTVSAREAYTRAFIVLGNKVWFHPEDQHLANLVLAGPNGILAFKAYGNETALPVKKDLDESLSLALYTPYNSVTFWLMFLNRWATDLGEGRAALERCFDTFWKEKKRPSVGEIYCQQGVVGNHDPEEQEVADATLAVTGKSKYRDKPFNGRFTLNDGPARPSLNPPPWDKKK
jgi:hypothetical protein